MATASGTGAIIDMSFSGGARGTGWLGGLLACLLAGRVGPPPQGGELWHSRAPWACLFWVAGRRASRHRRGTPEWVWYWHRATHLAWTAAPSRSSWSTLLMPRNPCALLCVRIHRRRHHDRCLPQRDLLRPRHHCLGHPVRRGARPGGAAPAVCPHRLPAGRGAARAARTACSGSGGAAAGSRRRRHPGSGVSCGHAPLGRVCVTRGGGGG